MKRTESLAKLHGWATHTFVKRYRNTVQARVLRSEAKAHGLNAVRAIREACATYESAPFCPTVTVRSEARAAFRAALSAVGLKTL